ncbi:MAG: ankyrin repeat domain-containing protein [Candidatus Dependentiae bacterium]|nr:ankyrin repeat domain-containing protein [Candidatus Dependentiae bacterium]
MSLRGFVKVLLVGVIVAGTAQSMQQLVVKRPVLHDNHKNYFLVGDTVEAEKFLDAAPENLEARDDQGWTPLMVAAFHGHKNLVGCLAARGAHVNACSADGCTVLMHMAVGRNTSISVMRLLVDKGAWVNIINPITKNFIYQTVEQRFEREGSCAREGGSGIGFLSRVHDDQQKQDEHNFFLVYSALSKKNRLCLDVARIIKSFMLAGVIAELEQKSRSSCCVCM